MFLIGQNFKEVHKTYSFVKKVTPKDIFYLKFDFSLHQRNTVNTPMETNNETKQR